MKHLAVLCLCAIAALTAGCKKKKPALPGQPAAGSVVCPSTETIVKAVERDQKDRTVKAACVVFAPGYYWLGAALSYDQTVSDVRVHLVSGGQAQRISDIEPLPTAALAELIKKSDAIQIRIRRGVDNRLVRMGVMGHKKGQQPEAEEIGMVLQLVAHQPPKLLWVGPGDQISSADGCHLERTVDFEMPFGSRLEMVTTTHARGGTNCTSGPASQQQIETKGVALKAGRALTGL